MCKCGRDLERILGLSEAGEIGWVGRENRGRRKFQWYTSEERDSGEESYFLRVFKAGVPFHFYILLK